MCLRFFVVALYNFMLFVSFPPPGPPTPPRSQRKKFQTIIFSLTHFLVFSHDHIIHSLVLGRGNGKKRFAIAQKKKLRVAKQENVLILINKFIFPYSSTFYSTSNLTNMKCRQKKVLAFIVILSHFQVALMSVGRKKRYLMSNFHIKTDFQSFPSSLFESLKHEVRNIKAFYVSSPFAIRHKMIKV
jgi:hypothetical protein